MGGKKNYRFHQLHENCIDIENSSRSFDFLDENERIVLLLRIKKLELVILSDEGMVIN